jgi:DNA-binding PadR family transcriptional regulator
MRRDTRATNPLALAVLTHLYEQPRHPYELAATLRERRKEASIKLNYGSLYTVIEALARERYIRAVETRREGRRPEKTVYAITAEGEAFMLEWMRTLLSVPVKEYPQFEAALSLIPVLPPEEAMSLLESRLQALRAAIQAIAAESTAGRATGLPRLFSIESEYHEQMLKAECGFVESLLRDLRGDAEGMVSTWKALRKTVLADRKPAGGSPPGKSSKRKRGRK